MASNSNFNITKVIVDPTSQEITNLEINGKAFESGSSSQLEERVYDSDNKLLVGYLFGQKPIAVQIEPSEGYDGIRNVTIEPGGLTGYPEAIEMMEAQFTYGNETPKNIAFYKAPGDPESVLEYITDLIDYTKPCFTSNFPVWEQERYVFDQNTSDGSVVVTIDGEDWVAPENAFIKIRIYPEDII